MEAARLLKTAFLQQNAFDDVDTFAVPKKQILMLKVIMHFYHRACEIIKSHIPIYRLLELPVLNEIHRMKENIPNDDTESFNFITEQIDKQMEEIRSAWQPYE